MYHIRLILAVKWYPVEKHVGSQKLVNNDWGTMAGKSDSKKGLDEYHRKACDITPNVEIKKIY